MDQNYRGKKLGVRLIGVLKQISALHDCYKIILDCNEKNVPFYERVTSFDIYLELCRMGSS